MLGGIALLIMSIVLYFTDLYILDPILSVGITLYVLYNGLGISENRCRYFCRRFRIRSMSMPWSGRSQLLSMLRVSTTRMSGRSMVSGTC